MRSLRSLSYQVKPEGGPQRYCIRLVSDPNPGPDTLSRPQSNRGDDSMHPNAELIQTFYRAFQKRDAYQITIQR